MGLAHDQIATFDKNSDVVYGTLEVGQTATLWIFGQPTWPNDVAKGMFVPKGLTGILRVAPLDIDAKKAFDWATRGKLKEYPLMKLRSGRA